ncbi:MAG: type II toxin-antitoxin system Phd/YefM family antitoxin [candidate division NC10 bacterium]|nr:type II toxin-antitoxin system Phd/YefM family antitoxin [candidate division NC10 bacterium]MCZ6752515.1 type II toxin-antitoxin system Phd/YefM family antitoxin [Acidobacteriota bacterium]
MAIKASTVRDNFGETLNRVAYGKERVVIDRHGKAVVAMVPIEDLRFLEELEDRLDVEAAKKILAESDERIPYEIVRKALGLA